MHYLVTGHTGFKGAWLVLLLKELGHEVSGISLDPMQGGLFDVAHVSDALKFDYRLDIRDGLDLKQAIAEIKPDIVMHLAAQALVRESYLDPRTTYETNVQGSLNLLEACQGISSIQKILYVTTDKVYENVNKRAGYKENEKLGGFDPYSASKAMADILAQSWSKSFPGPTISIARGGNVIGGGDVSKDRLLVDLVQGFQSGVPTSIRYPGAVRPWQHVLDCLSGYLAIIKRASNYPTGTAWNIGPLEESFISVEEMANEAAAYWKGGSWNLDNQEQPHEAQLLMLDSTLARNELNWSDKMKYPVSLHKTLDWFSRIHAGEDARKVTEEQIRDFLSN